MLALMIRVNKVCDVRATTLRALFAHADPAAIGIGLAFGRGWAVA
jgi:hypothetical protein